MHLPPQIPSRKTLTPVKIPNPQDMRNALISMRSLAVEFERSGQGRPRHTTAQDPQIWPRLETTNPCEFSPGEAARGRGAGAHGFVRRAPTAVQRGYFLFGYVLQRFSLMIVEKIIYNFVLLVPSDAFLLDAQQLRHYFSLPVLAIFFHPTEQFHRPDSTAFLILSISRCSRPAR
jgi:hypothetical protein